MTRPLTTFAVAIACTCTLGLSGYAQEHKTKIDVDHGKKITYTGCVQSGSVADSYILAHAIPMTESETAGTTGTAESTYLLVPDKVVTLHERVGERVRVTGVLIKPGEGEAKIETHTKENGSDKKTKEEIKREPYPQFRVVSITPLGKRCE